MKLDLSAGVDVEIKTEDTTMAKFDVVDLSNKKVSEIELSDDVFGAKANAHLLYEAARCSTSPPRRHGGGQEQLAGLRRRQKPWKQKGTGRARQGSTRASHWVGGGKAMGPKQRTTRTARPVACAVRRCLGPLAARRREEDHRHRRLPSDGKSKKAYDSLTKGLKLVNALLGRREEERQAPPRVRTWRSSTCWRPRHQRRVRAPPPDAGAHGRCGQGDQRGAAQAPRLQGEGITTMDLNTVIKGPLITEKLDKARESQRQYSFLVDRKATKHDVQRAVASQFKSPCSTFAR